MLDLFEHKLVGHIEIGSHVMAEDLGHNAVVFYVLLLDAEWAKAYRFSAMPGINVETAGPPIIFAKSAIF